MDHGDDLVAGDLVGELKIERCLGRGASGTVYGATHRLIGKRVAIKVLDKAFRTDPAMVSRFVAEARAVNEIRHAHIIDIFDFGHLPDGRCYSVMEWLEGVTLDALLRARDRLEVAEALAILRPIASALDAAHAKQITHRDLKPENVFVCRDADGKPVPKLLDFGIAKLMAQDGDPNHRTRDGMLLGTPNYMSPEQARGRGVDHRSDIYAFGVLTYQTLTGRPPFVGDSVVEILAAQSQQTPRPPSTIVPALAPLDAAILAMLEKSPDSRPASAGAAFAALAAAAEPPKVPKTIKLGSGSHADVPADPLVSTAAGIGPVKPLKRKPTNPVLGQLATSGKIVGTKDGAHIIECLGCRKRHFVTDEQYLAKAVKKMLELPCTCGRTLKVWRT